MTTSQLLISYAHGDFRPGDEALPPVEASASAAAYHIVNTCLAGRVRVNADGVPIVPVWAVHRIALEIEAIHCDGIQSYVAEIGRAIAEADAPNAGVTA